MHRYIRITKEAWLIFPSNCNYNRNAQVIPRDLAIEIQRRDLAQCARSELGMIAMQAADVSGIDRRKSRVV